MNERKKKGRGEDTKYTKDIRKKTLIKCFHV